jgi:hypothetical protein
MCSPLLMRWTAPATGIANVRFWLLSDILTGVLERLLIPRNQTSETECQLWRETRPLSPQQQTFRAGAQNVSD